MSGSPFAPLLALFWGQKLLDDAVLRKPGAGAWTFAFVTDGVLHAFPQLALSLWYFLAVVQTGLERAQTFSVAATLLAACYLLLRACLGLRQEGTGAGTGRATNGGLRESLLGVEFVEGERGREQQVHAYKVIK